MAPEYREDSRVACVRPILYKDLTRSEGALTIPLAHLEVLALDCQATGATPQQGDLLEIAWCRGKAAGAAPAVVSQLVRLPAGAELPPRIAGLTGIRARDLETATPPTDVAERLRRDLDVSVAVAHFARFERAFLDALLDPFPLDLVCTHEIACRLMPGLPRRGLRAVAGYFGHVMSEDKRAAAHVRATFLVWSALVERLRAAGVATLADLIEWIDAVAPARRGGRDFPVPREARLRLPDAPGVYRMRGKRGEVLYLGKAASLKRRVNSYFQHRRHGSERTPEMLTQTFGVDYTATATTLEAALRETDEIKELAPPYNVALRGREPEVWFASGDLRTVRPRPDAHHRLGPLPRRASIASLQALLKGDAGELAHTLNLPDSDVVRDGFDRFFARHGAPERVRLLRLGARLWLQRPEETEETEERDRELTPDRVLARLEFAVAHDTHLLRRARWLVRLSEASLVWRPRGKSGRRLLVIERGDVTHRADLDGDAAPPPPPGSGRALPQRLGCFDAATYDRLRVLTTELRRVVADGGPVELFLGRHLRLPALRRRLERV